MRNTRKGAKANVDNRKKKEYEHTGGSSPFLKHKEAAEKGQHVTLIDDWNNMHICTGIRVYGSTKLLRIRGRK
ncbi:hypothetical protein ACE6H2_010880 [Prunus campanulata]